MSSRPDGEGRIESSEIKEALESIKSEVDSSAGLDPREPDGDVLESFLRDKSYRAKTTRKTRRNWDEFVDWFQSSGNEFLRDLTTDELVRYRDALREQTEKGDYTIYKLLERVKQVLDWCAVRNWVPDDLGPWDEIYPDVRADDRERDNPLVPERGRKITEWVRNEKYAGRLHIEWILVFRLGLRRGACLALDRDHFHLGAESDPRCTCDIDAENDHPHLLLRDRPELGAEDDRGLPLKKRGERPPDDRYVALDRDSATAIEKYLFTTDPHDEPDKYGLQGLLQSRESARIDGSSLYRDMCYLTSPATYADGCDCSYCRNRDGPLTRRNASKCEESRGTHACRHGAITNMFDKLHEHDTLTAEAIADNVGTDVRTCRQKYDHAGPGRRFKRHADDWVAGLAHD